MRIHYNGLAFRPVSNTPNGQVSGDTTFHYQQHGDLLTATYQGGGIRLGQILGRVLADDSLDFCYQHLTDDGELRSGRCRSTPEVLADGRIRLHERWQWSTGDRSSGESVIQSE